MFSSTYVWITMFDPLFGIEKLNTFSRIANSTIHFQQSMKTCKVSPFIIHSLVLCKVLYNMRGENNVVKRKK